MDPLTLIVTALIAGAAAGGQDAASSAVRDAYGALRRRISGDGANPDITAAIQESESIDGGDRAALEAAVRRAEADGDSEVRVLAQRVLDSVPKQVFNDLRYAQGVHIGDGGTVSITIHNTSE